MAWEAHRSLRQQALDASSSLDGNVTVLESQLTREAALDDPRVAEGRSVGLYRTVLTGLEPNTIYKVGQKMKLRMRRARLGGQGNGGHDWLEIHSPAKVVTGHGRGSSKAEV